MTRREALIALRDVLKRHHDWHLAQTDPVDMCGVEVIPAEEYADSSMFEETDKALALLEKEIGDCNE